MGLVYVVADEQCVLVFGCSRHTDSSYRFGFLPVLGPRLAKSRSLQYRTRYGRGRGAAARAGRPRVGHRARGSNAVSSTTTRSRGSDTRPRCFHDARASSRPPRRYSLVVSYDTT